MKHILIVGQSFSAHTQYLTAIGYDYTILKDIKKTKYPTKRLKRRVVCDFSSKETILAAIRTLKKPADAVMATYESYILAAAWIAEALGLPGLPVATAEACTDKFLMRSHFAKAPTPISPAFAIITGEDMLRDFAARHGFPLIIKPANLAHSLHVTKNRSLEELLSNYRRTLKQLPGTYARYAPSREPKLLVEEFLEGRLYSVDAFTGNDGQPQVLENIVDYQTGYEVGFDDNFLYSRLLPTALPPVGQQALRECASLGIKTLGIRNAPSHVEIIMTQKGPRIVEIGARNGGYRERMHSIANGIDITGAMLAAISGQRPHITATRNDPCAVLELFPKKAGRYNGISHAAELESLASFNYLSLKVKPGDHVGKAADGYKMCAVVILHHKDPAQFARDLDYVNNNVAVMTD